MKPKVSIIIPVYNGEKYLRQAIDSCINQSYENIEIIVIDDGSKDETKKIVNEYGSQVQYRYKENGGVASALNVGIRMMSGEYFAWLSHDDIFMPQKIEVQLDAILQSGDKNKISIGNYIFRNEENNIEFYTDFQHYFPRKYIERDIFSLLWLEIHFSSFLFHKSHFERIGLFNEKLRTAQDNDFIFRLLKGQKTIFVENALSKVRIHRESGTNNYNNLVSQENSNLYIKYLMNLSNDELEFICKNKKAPLIKAAAIAKSMGQRNLFDIEQKIHSMDEGIRESFLSEYLIFGAGRYGIRMEYEIKAYGGRVLGYIDNSREKQGERLDGLPIYSLQEGIEKFPNIPILVAVKFHLPLEMQLQDNNIENYSIIYDVESKILKILSEAE